MQMRTNLFRLVPCVLFLACLLAPRTSPAASPEKPGSDVYCEKVSPLLGDVAIASGLMTRSDIEEICEGKSKPIKDLLGTENYTREIAAYLAFHLAKALLNQREGTALSKGSSFVLISGPKQDRDSLWPEAVLYANDDIAMTDPVYGQEEIEYGEGHSKKEEGYVFYHNADAYIVLRISYEYAAPAAADVVNMPWYKGRSRGEPNAAWYQPGTRCVDIRTQAPETGATRKWTFLINGVPISDDYRYEPGEKIKVIFPTSGRDSVQLRALANDGTISRGVQLTLSSTSECTVWEPDLPEATDRDDVYGLVDLSDDGSCDGRISRSQIRAAVKQYIGDNKVVDVDLPVEAASQLTEIDKITRELGQTGQLVEDRTDLGLQAGALVADFARWLRNESFGRPLLLKITCGQDDTIELSGILIDLPNLSNVRTGDSDMVHSESVLMRSQDELRDGMGQLLAKFSNKSMAWIEPGERRLDYYSEQLLSYHFRSAAETDRFRPSIHIAYVPNEQQAQAVCDSVADYNRLDMIEQDQIREFVDTFSPSGRACDDKCTGDDCVTKRWFERCGGKQRRQRELESDGGVNTGPDPVLVFEAEFCSAQDKKSCIIKSDDVAYYAIHDGDATGAVPFTMSRPGRYVAWISWDADVTGAYHPISAACFESAEDRIYMSPWNIWMEVGSMFFPAPGKLHSGEIAIVQAMIGVAHDWGPLRRGTWRAGLGYHQWRRAFKILPSWDDAGQDLLGASDNEGQLRQPMTYTRRAITLRTSVGFRFDAWGCWPNSWRRLAAHQSESPDEDEWRTHKRRRSSSCALRRRRAAALELLGGAGLSVGFYDVRGVEPWATNFIDKFDEPSNYDLDLEIFAGLRLRGPIAGGFGAYGFLTVGVSDLDGVGFPQDRGSISNNYNIFPLIGFGFDKGFKERR